LATQPKIQQVKLDARCKVKLPQVVIEELGLVKGSIMQVMYGKNYNAVIIIPAGAKPEGRQAERISYLVNEALM
jgi:hypothetical protein